MNREKKANDCRDDDHRAIVNDWPRRFLSLRLDGGKSVIYLHFFSITVMTSYERQSESLFNATASLPSLVCLGGNFGNHIFPTPLKERGVTIVHLLGGGERSGR